MPITPLHAGPHVTVGFICRRFIDLPTFVLANVVIDIEPLTVMLFKLNYPLHGYCHTFLIGGFLGLFWGVAAWRYSWILKLLMTKFCLSYEPAPAKTVVSGLLGAWFHILCDAPIYHDIKPFFPYEGNPLLGLISISGMYNACLILFLPATVLYFWSVRNFKGSTH